ncbi:argininosuccinate lyase [Anaerococcus sp. WCA-380-WT-2B]|uniref:Argininosuccinate lyase n=1 Tax=Anaerococcus porci TaxID=2652269 RepID=A0A6N7VWC1_9FIRM|nr:argininosuccinate lyase [Anaerococcus porci]MSS78363.1 argininosuccinate lyase [Anaerococcus porci]
MYLWGGHLGGLSEFTHEFNKSIDFDKVLFQEDIRGSIAHVNMLAKVNILSEEEGKIIRENLRQILLDIKDKKLDIDLNEEDIHSFIENELTKRIGKLGKKLHTARSRNDQCALDLRLYSKKSLNQIKDKLLDLIKAIIEISEDNLDVLMPGFTHMQHAQVTTFSHYIMAYGQMFYRDLLRLESTFERLNENPLGSCALATTSFNIDRFMTSQELGFSKPTENSMDSVSDRDYVLEILFNNSLIMMHLSRLCEELIYYSSSEYSYVKFSDKFSTGSSIMPQKKNPDMAELIRGKTGRVYGDLNTLLVIMKASPLSYNKDFQEDKEPLFDSINTVYNCLKIMKPMLLSLKINKKNMLKSAHKGYLNATDLADYLVNKNIPFREAYKIVGDVVNYAIKVDKALDELDLEIYKKFSDIFDDSLYDFIDLENSLNKRDVYGGPAKKAVKVQIKNLKDKIKNL